MPQLPKVLKHEPLVDAIFEVRMSEGFPLGDILPGALFSGLEQKPLINRLPAAEIPRPMREADPNLAFVPTTQLDIGDYWIPIGDRTFGVTCKLPYPKWPAFKAKILEILEIVKQIGLPGRVDRYSLKYVNLIAGGSTPEQIGKINGQFKLGNIEVTDDNIALRIERRENDVLHILSIATGAQANLADGRFLEGLMVDIDSVREATFPNYDAFAGSVENGIEELRQANKEKFFGCLTPEAINGMEPEYE